jgi:hypothetical protein
MIKQFGRLFSGIMFGLTALTLIKLKREITMTREDLDKALADLKQAVQEAGGRVLVRLDSLSPAKETFDAEVAAIRDDIAALTNIAANAPTTGTAGGGSAPGGAADTSGGAGASGASGAKCRAEARKNAPPAPPPAPVSGALEGGGAAGGGSGGGDAPGGGNIPSGV